MRDDDADAAAQVLLQLGEDRRLRFGIERRGRLVEDPDVGVAVHDPREREALPFAARQIVAALEEPPTFESRPFGICFSSHSLRASRSASTTRSSSPAVRAAHHDVLADVSS
jgi:hypothetical protein